MNLHLSSMLRAGTLGMCALIAGLLLAAGCGKGSDLTKRLERSKEKTEVAAPTKTPAAQMALTTDSLGLKIACFERGVYAISGNDLLKQGIDIRKINVDAMALVRGDAAVPISVEGADDHSFDPTDRIIFFARGGLEMNTPFINTGKEFEPQTEDFMLHLGPSRFEPLRYRDVTVDAPASPSPDYPLIWAHGRLHYEDNPIWKFYDDLANAQHETNYLYWAELVYPSTDRNNGSFQTDFALPRVDPSQPIEFQTQLIGASQDVRFHANTFHRVQIKINDAFTTTVTWPTGTRTVANFAIPPGVGHEGSNKIKYSIIEPELSKDRSAENPNRITIDDVLIDWFNVRFVQPTRAFNNYTEFSFPPTPSGTGATRFSIRDFNGKGVVLLDTTSQRRLIPKPYQLGEDSWNYAVNLAIDFSASTQTTHLIALTERQFRQPARVQLINLKHLFEAPSDCSLLILSHEDFINDLQPFKQWKESRGLKVSLVNISDLFNERSSGDASPEVLRNYIKHVYDSQTSPTLRYVLLVGDSVSIAKYKTYLPAYSYLQSGQHANDNYYATFGSPDSEPVIAVGRFSVATHEQIQNAIDKTIAYEKGGSLGPWRGSALLIAASLDWAEQDAKKLATNIFTPDFHVRMMRTDISANETGYAEKVNNELMGLMNKGNLMTIFLGHGGGTVWQVGPTARQGEFIKHLFDQSNVARMQNDHRLPLVMALTCYTNDFDNAYVPQTLGETFVNSKHGAIAVLGAAERTYVANNFAYSEIFLRLLHDHKFKRLGDYFAEAKRIMKDPMANSAYLLLGDPSLEFNLPPANVALSTPTLTQSGTLRFDYRLADEDLTSATLHCVLLDENYRQLDAWDTAVAKPTGTLSHALSLTEGAEPSMIRQMAVYFGDDKGRQGIGGRSWTPPPATQGAPANP